MADTNCITIIGDKIKLDGFDKISSEFTFCFYTSGVVISPTKLTDKYFYFPAKLDENRCIDDKQIIDILKRDRKFDEKTYFIESDDSYIEIEPHKSTL